MSSHPGTPSKLQIQRKESTCFTLSPSRSGSLGAWQGRCAFSLFIQTGVGLLAYLAKGTDSHTRSLAAIGWMSQSTTQTHKHLLRQSRKPWNDGYWQTKKMYWQKEGPSPNVVKQPVGLLLPVLHWEQQWKSTYHRDTVFNLHYRTLSFIGGELVTELVLLPKVRF